MGVTRYLKIHKMLLFGIGSGAADSLSDRRAVNYFTEHFIYFQSVTMLAITFHVAQNKRLYYFENQLRRVVKCFGYCLS